MRIIITHAITIELLEIKLLTLSALVFRKVQNVRLVRTIRDTKRGGKNLKQAVIIQELNNKLNTAIFESDLTLNEICDRAKISRHMLWQYRFYSVTPSALVLARLATTLGISTDYLLGISKRKEIMV